MTNKGKGKK